MAQQIEKLARFVAETTLEQVPKDVQWHAKLVVLDTIGVILAGASRPGPPNQGQRTGERRAQRAGAPTPRGPC
jgi:2-methylcitrate dehydratase PrpD